MGSTNRRNFMKHCTLGSAAAVAALSADGSFPRRIYSQESSPFQRIVYRDLGSTGFRASEIGFGCMNMREPELVHAAIDAGINYLDTAHYYMRGANEEIVGTVMKTRRDEVFLTTKVGLRKDLAAIPGEIETSLKRLQTDHVDLLLFHKLESRDGVLDEAAMKLFDTAREKGQARFIGISTHGNQKEVLDAAVESKFWEAVLIGYNYFTPPSVSEGIKNAREAGIGIIAMKNLITMTLPPSSRVKLEDIRRDKSSATTPEQALIKWVLEDKYVDTTIPGMTAFEHLADDLAIMGMKLTFDERRTLRRYGEFMNNRYCRGVAGCTDCLNQCPWGVKVSEINRCLRYVFGYNDLELARENYEALPRNNRLARCSDCDECVVRCKHGLDLSENIRIARELFT